MVPLVVEVTAHVAEGLFFLIETNQLLLSFLFLFGFCLLALLHLYRYKGPFEPFLEHINNLNDWFQLASCLTVFLQQVLEFFRISADD
jgi:hypothetical protein